MPKLCELAGKTVKTPHSYSMAGEGPYVRHPDATPSTKITSSYLQHSHIAPKTSLQYHTKRGTTA